MLPRIHGIALYPLYSKMPGGTILSGTDFTNVPCARSCEIVFADGVPHSLVCAGEIGGESAPVSVEGEIVRADGADGPPAYLEPRPLGRALTGRDGSCRAFWTWPNTPACREVNATYEVRLRLVLAGAAGCPQETVRDEGPFPVTLLPAREPDGVR